MRLREIFGEYKNQRFKFIESGGNSGDSLIYVGAKKLAYELDIKYEIVSYKSKIESDNIIYLNGGGGYNSWWGWTGKLLRLIRDLHPKNTIIVGPSTTSLELDYLKKVLPKDDEKIIFFAREMTTYNFIKDNFYSQTYLDHDTALLLSKEDRYFKEFTGNISIENRYSLLVLRKDYELSSLPEKISLFKYDLVCDPVTYYPFPIHNIISVLGKTSETWSRIHLKASKITTNRTHSAIMGIIAGKKVGIFANSYHKNRSIWEYSLKERGVKWIE